MLKLCAADGAARAFVHGTKHMAGQNVIAEIRVQNAKLDVWIETQNAALDARGAMLDARQRAIRSLRWMVGFGFIAPAILVTVLELLD